MGPSGVPFALARVPDRAGGSVPEAQRAFHERFARSKTSLTPLRGRTVPSALRAVPGAPKGVPRADNRTEILSPTNKQYKGRKRALRAFQVVSDALKGVIITLKKLIQIDGAIGADDLHLAHDIPYALGSVRCVV